MAGILTRIPKSCWVARAFGSGASNAREARRQLQVWRKDIGRGIGADVTVHLYHSKARGWCLVLCGPDYARRIKA